MPRNAAAYDTDFFAWTEEQARLLRANDLTELDRHNLAEEIESVGRSDRREIRNRLVVLLTHLLKWRFQPEARSGSWRGSIVEQRGEIIAIVEDSPSLRTVVPERLSRAYRRAREVAAEEMGLPETVLPAECPFTPEQILDENFLPE